MRACRKTFLDGLLEEKGIEVPAMSKVWEPVRAYQRRLITVMSKDPCKSRPFPGCDGMRRTDSNFLPAAIQKAATAERNKNNKSKPNGKGKGKGEGKGKAAARSDDEDEEDQLDQSGDDDEGQAGHNEEEEESISPPKKRKAPVVSQELYGPGGSPSKRRRTSLAPNGVGDAADLENDDALEALLGDDGTARARSPTPLRASPERVSGDEATGGDGEESNEQEESEEVVQPAKPAAAGAEETETGDLSP